MRHESLWMATASVPSYAPLSEDLTVDACVVGAGIAGLTTAYLLARAGKLVAVLDDGPIGGGMTGMTSGHLVSMLDDRYFDLEHVRGKEAAKLAAESHAAAIDRIEQIVREERIDCDFERVTGYLYLAAGDKAATLDKELDAAQRAGIAGVTRLEHAPFDSFDTGPCLVWPNQGQFHPLKYLAGLAQAIQARGGRIFSGSHVDDIQGDVPVRVSAGSRTVTAQAVVVATNSPINDRLVIHTKQAPYMTYVVGARVPPGSVPSVLAWDTGDPYHYIRVYRRGDHDVLIVGGEDHKSGQAHDIPARYQRLALWTREKFPMVTDVEFAWGGQVMETVDYVSFTGRNPMQRNVYVHTGDSAMGLTHGTIAGLLICDLIEGRDNRWTSLYDPSRKPLGAASTYAHENLNVARQYGDWLTGGEVKALEEIHADSGAVLRRGLSKIAVYRDESGAFHEYSAKCPHLGCVVQWNGAEKTWDCPCHGSRFDRYGHVMNGPSNRDLAPAAEAKEEKAA